MVAEVEIPEREQDGGGGDFDWDRDGVRVEVVPSVWGEFDRCNG